MPKSIDKNIHMTALRRFNNISWTLRDERDYQMQDRRFCFIAGAQWEGNLFEQFQNKPRFEVNKVRMSVMRIGNEYRQNRMTVDFTPGDGIAGPNDKMADFLDGAYRAMEYDSVATEAYDNGFDEALSGGFGAIRFVTQYEDEYDEDNDYQTVRMEPIVDACRSVYFDLQAKRQDKSDAEYCFVISSMTHEAYEEEYGDFDYSTWPVDATSTQFDWYTPDVIYIAEYFLVGKEDYKIFVYEDEKGNESKFTEAEFNDTPGLRERTEASGLTFVRERKVKRRIITKYVLSGAGLLGKPQKIAGKHLPVVPVYGQRAFIDNLERCSGHVRLAKDVQRLKNIQLSRLGELSIISPNEKPIFSPAQVAGHEERWADDNLKNYPYQLVNPLMDAAGNEVPSGPVAYTKPPQVPTAMAALLQLTEQDMKELLGNQQEGEKIAPNTSGDGVALVQAALDMSTAIYLDNMRKAVQRCGEVWFSIIQDIFVEEGRNIKVIQTGGAKAAVTLGETVLNDEGQMVPELDIAKSKMDVNVAVGPSSSSKRSSLVKTLIAMSAVNNDPETGKVLTHTAMANLEGEGLSDTRDWSRRQLLMMGAAKPTEEEAKQMEEAKANEPPNPQDEYLAAEAKKSEADAEKSMVQAQQIAAEADKTVEETKKIQAQTMEIMSDVDREEVERAMEILEKYAPETLPAPAQSGARGPTQ